MQRTAQAVAPDVCGSLLLSSQMGDGIRRRYIRSDPESTNPQFIPVRANGVNLVPRPGGMKGFVHLLPRHDCKED